MGLLQKVGLARKKARPVGTTLERGVDDSRTQRRNSVLAKTSVFLALIALTLIAFPRGEGSRYNVEIGDVWQHEMHVAPFEFAILKEEETLRRERAAVRENAPPYFAVIPDAQERMTANRDTLAHQLDRLFEAYADFQAARSQGRFEEAAADSARYMTLRRNARLKVPQEQWVLLLEDYVARVPRLASPSRRVPRGPRTDERLREAAFSLASQMIRLGVLDVPIDSVHTEEIVIRDSTGRTDEYRPKSEVFGLNEAYETAQDQFSRDYEGVPEEAALAGAFFRALFQPSLRFKRADTIREWQRKQAAVSPTRGIVRRGEVIVRRGDLITEEVQRKLRSLDRAESERTGERLVWKRILGQLILTLATFFFFFLYLYLLRRQIFDNNRLVVLMALVFGIIIGLYAIALRMPVVLMYAVPVGMVAVLLTVMFDSRVSLFGTVTLAFIGSLLLGLDFEFAFATIFAGALGVFSVRDIKNRGQFFVSAGLVFIGYAVVLSASWLVKGTPANRLLWDLLFVGINSFLLILAYPLLWVFERTFGVTTDLTLLELSDTNRPLLKELSFRAPGTFNHVLQVANLAEAAADAVGANALLTRVGALYHDVGKMKKPEYFVENQRPGMNPHDQLKPRMSALIIASHVKEGLDIGREHNLPKRVLDFIPMHHGTTRIEYFYRRAEEQRAPEDPPVLESEFRYPGPRPRSKETGILMLADSVEAASRSLSNPTHKRLEALIEMLVDARREDGQLDDTDLTFRDLARIKETFLSMLLAIYHVRVKYPGQEKNEAEPEPLPVPEALAAADDAGGTPSPADPLGDGAPVRPAPKPDASSEIE